MRLRGLVAEDLCEAIAQQFQDYCWSTVMRISQVDIMPIVRLLDSMWPAGLTVGIGADSAWA